MVLTHRPAKIKAEFAIDTSYEGRLEDIQYLPEIVETQKKIWSVMREEVERSRIEVVK